MTSTATPPRRGFFRRWAGRWRYGAVLAGSLYIGNCAGSCAREPVTLEVYDVDGDRTSDVNLTDRGYVFGWGNRTYTGIQKGKKFEFISDSELCERVREAAKERSEEK